MQNAECRMNTARPAATKANGRWPTEDGQGGREVRGMSVRGMEEGLVWIILTLDTSPAPGDQFPMLIVHILVHVKPECVQRFKEATVENARQSIQEPGIARFDFVQQLDDPTRFALIEIYRNPAASAAHKETAHYQKWRDLVAPMMAEARAPTKFAPVFPDHI